MQAKLLDPSHHGDRLPKHLGVPDLTDADLLIQVLLPDFETSSRQRQEAILLWIVNNWTRLRANAGLCEALSKTPFVTAGKDALIVSSPPE